MFQPSQNFHENSLFPERRYGTGRHNIPEEMQERNYDLRGDMHVPESVGVDSYPRPLARGTQSLPFRRKMRSVAPVVALQAMVVMVVEGVQEG